MFSTVIILKRRIRENNNGTYRYYEYGSFSDSQIGEASQHPYTVRTGAESVPGLTTYLAFAEENFNAILDENTPHGPRNYHWNQAAYSSGIDCSGLAHRVALYDGNRYVVSLSQSKLGTKHFAVWMYEYNSETKQYEWRRCAVQVREEDGRIRSYDATILFYRDGESPDWTWNLRASRTQQVTRDEYVVSRVVPGDLLVRGGRHVMIIHDLRYDEGDELIRRFNQVEVIHATQGERRGGNRNKWWVMRSSWDMIANNYKTYRLRRYNYASSE